MLTNEKGFPTIEIERFNYDYLVKQEEKLAIIKKIAKEKDFYEGMRCIRAVLGIKETEGADNGNV